MTMFASADRPRIDRPWIDAPWIKRLALAAVAAVAIGAAALPSKPAEAQVVVGVAVPYYGPGYYRPYYSPGGSRIALAAGAGIGLRRIGAAGAIGLPAAAARIGDPSPAGAGFPAVDLHIDKARREPGAVRQFLHRQTARQVAPRHQRGDRAGLDDDDVVTMRGRAVEHRISGDRVNCGAFHRVRVIACGSSRAGDFL